MRKIYTLWKLTVESAVFALTSLRVNKFRTFLSLFGVSIGIFSIVAVFCAVDALKSNVNEGLASLGGDVVVIDTWPWMAEEGQEYEWWDYLKRPSVSLDNFEHLKSRVDNAEAVVYLSFNSSLIRYKRNSISRGDVISATEGVEKVMSFEIGKGRDITPAEYEQGKRVAVIGVSVVEALFGNEEPLGKTIKIANTEAVVIGVFKKSGQSMVSVGDTDETIKIPLKYGNYMYNLDRGGSIYLLPKLGVEEEDFIAEVKMSMRETRRLSPNENDDFAINQMSFITNQVDMVLGVVNTVGWVIGGFSLLIGGFGIVNIMFVSVKERTPQIGIQKALGAKPYFILLQFLVEAAILSSLGGLLGIIFVYLGTKAIPPSEDFTVVLNAGNAITGLLIAILAGVLSGYIPALFASRLEPVRAINDQ